MEMLMNVASNLLITAAKVLKVLVLTLVVGMVCSIPLMLLWNWLVPAVFGFASVNLLQAFGLSLLAEMLFSPYTLITVKLQ